MVSGQILEECPPDPSGVLGWLGRQHENEAERNRLLRPKDRGSIEVRRLSQAASIEKSRGTKSRKHLRGAHQHRVHVCAQLSWSAGFGQALIAGS